MNATGPFLCSWKLLIGLCCLLALQIGDDNGTGGVAGDVQDGTAHVEDAVHTGYQGDAFYGQTN